MDLQGWDRRSRRYVSSYSPFKVASFPDITEKPQYFKTEVLQSQEMSFGELRRYIAGLRQSGFDTKRLSVQLNEKLAFPVITLVMAILAVPFRAVHGQARLAHRHSRGHRASRRLLGNRGDV